MLIRWFPLMLIVIIFYNALIFLGPLAFGQTPDEFLMNGFSIAMFSGDIRQFSVGDFIMLLGLMALFVEVVKSTRTGSAWILNHTLSMAVCILAMIEFIVLPGFSTTPFFFLMAMSLFDVVAGFTVSIVTAKRDFGQGGGVMVG
jgi:hypothetical protein